MIYLKTEVDGKIREIDIYGDEFYTKCCICGNEFQVDEELQKNILVEDGSFSGVALGCGCTLNDHNDRKPSLVRIK